MARKDHCIWGEQLAMIIAHEVITTSKGREENVIYITAHANTTAAERSLAARFLQCIKTYRMIHAQAPSLLA